MAAFWQVKLHYGVWLGAVDLTGRIRRSAN